MKHANISLFVPHMGCPHQCSFCNQKTISGSIKQLTPEDVLNTLKEAESHNNNPENTEIAFFGGSFTAINRDYMVSLLEVAKPFVDKGAFCGIRISTRPDAIDEEVLNILKEYRVTAIELGAQSTDEEVLSLNKRGHTREDVFKASQLIKAKGFSLGLQMMTGLSGDTFQKSLKTADDINAEITRMPSETKFLNSISAKIVGTADNTEVLTVKSTLTGVITDPVIPRSSKILNVPYVAQGVNTCWAAAGVAVGKYYTGISSYTADELAAQMGYPNQSAGMSVTKSLLTRFYQVNTTYYSGRLSDSVAINLFQQSKPIIAGFTGYAYINGNIGSVAHMVVLCGYDDHATGVNITFYVRDSEHTSLKSVISYSADKLALDYNEGVLLYWVEGLY